MGNRENGRLKPATETVQSDRHKERQRDMLRVREIERKRARERYTAYAATKRFLERQRQSLPQHAVNFRVPCPIVILNTKWRHDAIAQRWRKRERERERADSAKC